MRGKMNMALIQCPECEKEVSNSAEKCPNCGYNIRNYIKLQEEEKLKEERRQAEEEYQKRKQEDQEKRKEARRIRYDKYFGTSKKKLVSYSVIVLIVAIMIAMISFYVITTKDIREIKNETPDCVERLNDIENNLYKYNVIADTKVYVLNYLSFELADGAIGEIRELYNELSDSDKTKYNEYLQVTYDMSWDDLDSAFRKYGLNTSDRFEYIENGDDFYKNLLNKMRSGYEESKGDVTVTNKDCMSSGDNFVISGTVKNTTKSTVYFVKVKVTLNNDSGDVLNTENTYAVGDEGLAPGESSTFTCYIDKVDNGTKFNAYVYDYDY